MPIDYRALQGNIRGFGNTLAQAQKKKQEREQTIQDLFMKAILQAWIKQQTSSPYTDIANQIKLQDQLNKMIQNQQFQRRGDIGYGGVSPTKEELFPLVPQRAQQDWLQRAPTMPDYPALAGKLRQQIQQPYQKAGQTLVPTATGWGGAKVPTQKLSIYPIGYREKLRNAVEDIKAGADPKETYQRMAVEFPKQSVELKRILLFTSTTSSLFNSAMPKTITEDKWWLKK